MFSPWRMCLLACIFAAATYYPAEGRHMRKCVPWTSKVEGCQPYVCVEGKWHSFQFDAVTHCCAQNQEPPCGETCLGAARQAAAAAETVMATAPQEAAQISRVTRFHKRKHLKALYNSKKP